MTFRARPPPTGRTHFVIWRSTGFAIWNAKYTSVQCYQDAFAQKLLVMRTVVSRVPFREFLDYPALEIHGDEYVHLQTGGTSLGIHGKETWANQLTFLRDVKKLGDSWS